MSDEHVENTEAPEGSAGTPELSRKEKAAARRAEFEAAKAAKAEQQAAKNAEKAAATAAAREEKLAAKQAHDELRAAAKATKEAARAAKKAAKKAEKTSGENEGDADSGDAATKGRKERRGEKEKKEKKEKDPYRPRFAVAPVKVRAFTLLAAAFAFVHVAGAVLLLLEATSSPVLGVVPSDVPSTLVYVGAAVSMVVAGLWIASASLLCAGRVRGKHLGVVVLVLGLPLSLVSAPLLFSDDVRNWAL
jgi:hypothetical protein